MEYRVYIVDIESDLVVIAGYVYERLTTLFSDGTQDVVHIPRWDWVAEHPDTQRAC